MKWREEDWLCFKISNRLAGAMIHLLPHILRLNPDDELYKGVMTTIDEIQDALKYLDSLCEKIKKR